MTVAVILLGATIATAAERAPAAAAPRQRGIVVEAARDTAGIPAGLQAGDRLLSWERDPVGPDDRGARGAFEDAFDLLEVQGEQQPRGPVRLQGWRGSRALSVVLGPASAAVPARPPMPEAVMPVYEQARERMAQGDVEAGVAQWRASVERAESSGERGLACWLRFQLGLALAKVNRNEDAHGAFAEALRLGPAVVPAVKLAHVLDAQGTLFQQQSRFAEAEAALGAARGARAQPDHSLLAAADDYYRGYGWMLRGDLAAAEKALQEALAVQRRLAPQSLSLALTLTRLAEVQRQQGQAEKAMAMLDEALRLEEVLAPDGLDMARTLTALGHMAFGPTNIDKARAYYERALGIWQRLAPDSISVAAGLNNMGLVAAVKWDWATAENFYRRSVAIRERLAPDSVGLAGSLRNLGSALSSQNDFDGAEEMERRALRIQERVAPDSLGLAGIHVLLGAIAVQREDWAAAEDWYRKALAIQRKVAPGGSDESWTLWAAGNAALHRGDLGAAEPDLMEALSRWQGTTEPLSAEQASLFLSVGVLYRAKGQPEKAVEWLRRALDAGRLQDLLHQRPLASMGYYWGETGRELTDVLVDLDRPQEAYAAWEELSARSLLLMLAERDLVPRAVSAEREAEKQRLDAEYDQVQGVLARLDASKDPEKARDLSRRLHAVREAQEAWIDNARAESPRAAEVRFPKFLDLAGARRTLDPGTVLLVYSVEQQRTLLFVVEPDSGPSSRPDGLSVFVLPVGRAELRQEVQAFLRLISEHDQSALGALRRAGGALYRRLIEPAEAVVARHRRILLAPDGPLHVLPFAALVRARRTPKGAAPQYLVEWKPLHQTLSATVYAEVKKRRETATVGGRLVAFGDPWYPTIPPEQVDRIGDRSLRAVFRRTQDLAPLPATRAEVQAVARHSAVPVTTYLGREATEERAKTLGTDVRYVHFACHGMLDPESPLDSGLVLSLPADPGSSPANGVLQVWEIFQQIHLQADLVTLSACESGLGRNLSLEGVVGLTRAFQYAGARSVVASLWGVADFSTAHLMDRFYARLFGGQSKDEALRQAQLDLIRAPGAWRHPFFWSAFQLYGDWR